MVKKSHCDPCSSGLLAWTGAVPPISVGCLTVSCEMNDEGENFAANIPNILFLTFMMGHPFSIQECGRRRKNQTSGWNQSIKETEKDLSSPEFTVFFKLHAFEKCFDNTQKGVLEEECSAENYTWFVSNCQFCVKKCRMSIKNSLSS